MQGGGFRDQGNALDDIGLAMSNSIFLIPMALSAQLMFTGCIWGDHLGKYNVERARLVRQLPPDAFGGGISPPYPEYIEIELSSATDLSAADTGAGLYVESDFCPLQDAGGLGTIISFGPLDADGRRVEGWERQTKLTPHLRDGRYHYLIYVVPRYGARPDVIPERTWPAYDIGNDDRNVCVRFLIPGYTFIPSRSSVLTIPKNIIARAMVRPPAVPASSP